MLEIQRRMSELEVIIKTATGIYLQYCISRIANYKKQLESFKQVAA